MSTDPLDIGLIIRLRLTESFLQHKLRYSSQSESLQVHRSCRRTLIPHLRFDPVVPRWSRLIFIRNRVEHHLQVGARTVLLPIHKCLAPRNRPRVSLRSPVTTGSAGSTLEGAWAVSDTPKRPARGTIDAFKGAVTSVWLSQATYVDMRKTYRLEGYFRHHCGQRAVNQDRC